nr:hypothetical protein [Halomonas gemina]
MAAAAEKAKLGADIQLSQRQNNDWRIVHGLEAGAVIALVEALPSHLQALARYCFGPFTHDELAADAEVVQIALYRQLLADGVKLPGQGRRKPTAKQLETLRYLCAAALYHHSEVTYPYRRQGLPTPKAVQRWMLEECGEKLEVRFWSRSDRVAWGALWERNLCILDSWEAECLAPMVTMYSRVA